MKIAVVMGGYSDESVISLRSGQLILNHLNKDIHEIYEVHILNEGWYVKMGDQKLSINRADFSFENDGNTINFDVAINTIHGTPGEDGHLQSYWELIDLPYTGCGFYQSALTFSKRDTLSVLGKFDIPKANSVYITKGQEIDGEKIAKTLGFPFFVKPNQSGSSLGVSMVKELSELDKALAFAFTEDKDILIESQLKGVEISVGVMKLNGNTRVLGITEIVSGNDFFDYEAKYLGKSEEITPARLSSEVSELVEQSAAKIYEALGMQGFSRIDFIVMNDIPHFIEINTNPGLSPQSIFPQQAAYANLNFSDLLENEIKLALERKPIWKK